MAGLALALLVALGLNGLGPFDLRAQVARQDLAAALDQYTSAPAVHVTGTFDRDGHGYQVDVTIDKNGDSQGTVVSDGNKVEERYVGGHGYALAGFPPLVGFFGKLFLFTAGVSAGWTWLVVIGVLTSVVSVAYYLRVVVHVFTPTAERREVDRTPGPLVAVTVSAALAVVLGIFPSVVQAAGVLGAGPLAGH